MFNKLRHTQYIEIILGGAGILLVALLFGASFFLTAMLVRTTFPAADPEDDARGEIAEFQIEKARAALGLDNGLRDGAEIFEDAPATETIEEAGGEVGEEEEIELSDQ